MRFIIYGAGGIGGVIGAELFQAGHSVALIARGAHLAAIRKNGLVYENPHGSYTLDIPVFGHPSEISFDENDVVVLTMKSQHSLAAMDDLRAAAGGDIPVICCQNGVANERMALRRFRQVYAMVVYLPAHALDPGVVQTHSAKIVGILDAGVYPRGVDSLITTVTAALEQANFSANPDPEIMRWKYGKLILNMRNALFAICARSDGARAIGELAEKEAMACFEAAGIDFTDAAALRERRGDMMARGNVKGMARSGGSSWQSIMKGSGDIEADYLNGEIVLLGRLHGVPTPVNRALQRMANDLARAKGEAQSTPLAALDAQIEIEKNRS